MRTFTCVTIDKRYTVPTLSFVQADDEDAARLIVLRDLADNPDHQTVEARIGDDVLFVEVRPRPETKLKGRK
ncbi:MAG: hypothetical protein E7812_10325 [Phenylobacterium sp.]|nr:MAG: hypothetical protein E7812_10325 [Phenylobacterium sp.]